MTPRERANYIYENCTSKPQGQFNDARLASIHLFSELVKHIEEAVVDERRACSKVAEDNAKDGLFGKWRSFRIARLILERSWQCPITTST